MAAILRTPALPLSSSLFGVSSAESPRALVSFSSPGRRPARPLQLKLSRSPSKPSPRFPAFTTSAAASGDTAETKEIDEVAVEEDSSDETVGENVVNGEEIATTEELTASIVMASLQSYKEALANDDQSAVAEIEAFLQSIENEKNSLANKVAALSAELLTERDRVLRISADFDNFRKRTERERLSLMTKVQGEVVESLLPVLDNFERAKDQIKVETEGEEKINNSYQSIYKQFQEILTSLGVEAVETVGTAFDPLLHEAIMREESSEYEEGIVLQEFRKGFKLGERLLRPSMVKVSAGPGPSKSDKDPIASRSDEDPIPPSEDIAPPEVKEDSRDSDDGVDDGSDD
ncbi:uncharacterized protein A4U43_C05F17500 [Asparagus officinalis]|uniref:GrpE protein homolog n=1 Tax=Asparagus officinalis TaxID=4686 RepID=A0A5P1EW70_ASPOF|nr:uncharacterized protein LOC109843982 [Asparagus officinalis]ONK68929.1 uncharacterized protein A4U43_C05F17500 [Asparagus officinalis]